MPETYTQCSVWEVAIAVSTKSRESSMNEGDIVAVRKAGPQGIGTGEMKDFLWVRVCGWDDAQVARLTEAIGHSSGRSFQKRRFQIPLGRLRQVVGPPFSLSRAHDRQVAHQPCLVPAEPEYVVLTETGVSTVNMIGYQGTGRVRLALPEPCEVVHCSDMNECSPVVAVQVPLGWSWSWPWKEDMGLGRDALKAKYQANRWSSIAARMRDETRRLKTEGPLVEIRHPQGHLADTSISYTLTIKRPFPGQFLACHPPIDLTGLVYDTQRMRMVESL